MLPCRHDIVWVWVWVMAYGFGFGFGFGYGYGYGRRKIQYCSITVAQSWLIPTVLTDTVMRCGPVSFIIVASPSIVDMWISIYIHW